MLGVSKYRKSEASPVCPCRRSRRPAGAVTPVCHIMGGGGGARGPPYNTKPSRGSARGLRGIQPVGSVGSCIAPALFSIINKSRGDAGPLGFCKGFGGSARDPAGSGDTDLGSATKASGIGGIRAASGPGRAESFRDW